MTGDDHSSPDPVQCKHIPFLLREFRQLPLFSTLWRADKVPHTPLRAPFRRNWQANELFLQRGIVLCWFDQVWRFSIAALLSGFGLAVFPHLPRRGLVPLDLCFPARTWTSARSPNYMSCWCLDIFLFKNWNMGYGLILCFLTKLFPPKKPPKTFHSSVIADISMKYVHTPNLLI